jgi:hypothetical protein
MDMYKKKRQTSIYNATIAYFSNYAIGRLAGGWLAFFLFDHTRIQPM